MKVAESEGFEPSRGFIPWHVSSVLVSATHPRFLFSYYTLVVVSLQMLWIVAAHDLKITFHVGFAFKTDARCVRTANA